VAGPQGADGAFGLQGPQGTQGPAGPAGPQGPAGAGSTHRSIVLPLSALDISTVNATFAPTRGFVGGNSTIPVLKFPANGFRTFAYASIVLPSDWNGTDVTIRYSWTSNSTHSGEQPAINWDFWWLGPNTDITAANGHGQTTSQTGVTPLAQQWHVVTNTTATLRTVFDPSGPTTLSLKLEREDDLASDTLTADFDLLGITIEYNVISS
jgi:hypothetical protein